MFTKKTEPPEDYWVLDCEFADTVEGNQVVKRPLEIALVRYRSGSKLREYVTYLCWSNMRVCDLKRGMEHSKRNFATYQAKGKTKLVPAEVMALLGSRPLPIVGWNVETDLNCLVKAGIISEHVNGKYFALDQYIRDERELDHLPGLDEEMRRLNLAQIGTRHKAINDVLMTEAVFEHYCKPATPAPKYYLLCTASGYKANKIVMTKLKKWLAKQSGVLVQCTTIDDADFVVYLGPTAKITKDQETRKIRQARRSGKTIFRLAFN